MRSFFNKFKGRIVSGMLAASTVMVMPISAQAVTIKNNLKAETVVGNILDYLLTAGQLVGGGVLIYAIISFALSIAQENPDQRSRAIMFCVAGALLVSIKSVLKAINVIN